ncbi:hypothetical protein MKW98_001734 [Papaver atlanticum]|uniref:F-box domain-containing protein n=1 Tax=Papaver atlanticum TaxID=357466 RepID=A0AAD4X8I7_9MAGN|nr:hypothetical protein MKW98_001734 [Papaver atlanticum]
MSLQNHLRTRLDDKLLRDILINLPVKSLMRFKCVSKRWQSLIQDSSFAKSHLSRSKSHPPQLLISSWNGDSKIIYTPGDEFKSGEAVHKVTISWITGQVVMLKQSIDGLFCFVDDSYSLTCIYNLGTRQITPWEQSAIPLQGGQFVKQKPFNGFGFDHLTKKYEVLRVWEICRPGF